MIERQVRIGAAAAWAACFALAACSASSHEEEHRPGMGAELVADSVIERHRAETATLEPGLLRTVATAEVIHWRGLDDRPFEVAIRTAAHPDAHARPFGTTSLATAFRSRTPNVGQYPCASCHLGRTIVLRDERRADVHETVVVRHPSLTGSTCSTCHSAADVELLGLKSGERATLDHAYRLCAECHNSEATAWAAGAHGKRLDGWQGRRVVMGCADCHDPHDPTIGKRVPFRAPQLGRTR